MFYLWLNHKYMKYLTQYNLHFNNLWFLYNVAFFINIVFAFQALQHGLGECEGDVDRGSKEWEGEEEV